MEMEQRWIHDYSRATYVDFGHFESGHYKAYSKKCASELDWEYDEQAGDPDLIINFVNGNWDSKNYLIVEPGQKIEASFDDRIVRAK